MITLPAGLSLPNAVSDSYVVIEVAGSGSVRNFQPGAWKYVVKTPDDFRTENTNDALGHGLYFRNSGESGDVRVELRGAATTRGAGATGMRVRVDGSGKATAVNMGTIATHGDTHTSSAVGTFILPAYGVFAQAVQGDAEAVNRGEISTGGDGARGIFATARGSAVATNHGRITVSGSPHVSGSEYRSPHGIFAWGGTAEAANFGTVETRGDRGRGVYARGSVATATNRGTIVTRGNRAGVEGNFLSAMGVAAQSGGDATAVNAEGAAVDTYGTNADALFVRSGTGDANAVNAGALRTHNTVSDPANRLALAAEGIYARSDSGNVTVVNEATGSVRTAGPRTWGIHARTSGDGADASATVTVTNRGSVETRGWNADGVVAAAYHGGSEANPNAVRTINAGAVRTQGDMASGIIAAVDVRDRGTSFGSVRAENAGTISTSGGPGDGTNPTETASGVVAAFFSTSDDAISDAGDATAVNSGTVTVAGAGAAGLVARTYGTGAATVENSEGGTVDTRGKNADAMYARSDAGAVNAVNAGALRTHNTVSDPANRLADASEGIYARSERGNVTVVNEATGSVRTAGPRTWGIHARTNGDGADASATVTVTNRGSVETQGSNADGVVAAAYHGGSEANPNAVTTTSAGLVRTQGDMASGIIAAVDVRDRGTSFGSARAENAGTISTSGGPGDGTDPTQTASGVVAAFFSTSDDAISDAGDATAINSGTVTVAGAGAAGLVARTYGSGAATVEMNGGAVVASSADDPATTADEGGIGIWAATGASGRASVTVGNAAVVRAPVAARLEGGSTRLDLSSGWLVGDVRFGSGDNTLNVRQSGVIVGDVAFGDGEDALILDISSAEGIGSVAGSVTGLENMIKRGSGVARVRDVTFSGSRLAVEDGMLSVRGHLDLGGDGAVTIENAGRLQVEVGDLAGNPQDHGRITAGNGVHFEEGAERTVRVAHAPDRSAAQRTASEQVLQTAGIAILVDGTPAVDGQNEQSIGDLTLTTETREGTVNTVGTVSDGVAQTTPGAELPIARKEAPPPDEEQGAEADAHEAAVPAVKRKDRRDRRFLIGGGGLFALLMFAFDPFHLVETGGSSLVAAVHPADGREGVEARAFTADARVAGGTMRGVTLGVASRLGGGLNLGVSATPRPCGDGRFRGGAARGAVRASGPLAGRAS